MSDIPTSGRVRAARRFMSALRGLGVRVAVACVPVIALLLVFALAPVLMSAVMPGVSWTSADAAARTMPARDGDARLPSASDAARMAEVDEGELPREAQRVLKQIREGGPFRYAKDGSRFGNFERRLPKQPRGYYTEYTVPTPGARNRGARRIIAGGEPTTSGEYYYTEDHYETFSRIREKLK